MEETPKPLNEPILNSLGLSLIGIISTASAVVGSDFVWALSVSAPAIRWKGSSFAFASFAINSMIYIFAYRSLRRSTLQFALSANKPLIWAVVSGLVVALLAFLVPGLRQMLSIVPLHLDDWLLIAGVAVGLLTIIEVGKWFTNRWQRTIIR